MVIVNAVWVLESAVTTMCCALRQSVKNVQCGDHHSVKESLHMLHIPLQLQELHECLVDEVGICCAVGSIADAIHITRAVVHNAVLSNDEPVWGFLLQTEAADVMFLHDIPYSAVCISASFRHSRIHESETCSAALWGFGRGGSGIKIRE